MNKWGDDIRISVEDFYLKYHYLDDDFSSFQLNDDSWSLKEILGHLIDSASNNHQRFVRLQRERILEFPSYHYDWIKTQQYNTMPYSLLLETWKSLNLLLASIVDRIPETVLDNRWMGDDGDISLEHLVIDYIRHLKEHLEQFDKRFKEQQRRFM